MLQQVKLLLKNVKIHIFIHIIIDFRGFSDVRGSVKTPNLMQINFSFFTRFFKTIGYEMQVFGQFSP